MAGKSAQEPLAVPEFYVVPVHVLLRLFKGLAIVGAFNEFGRAEYVAVVGHPINAILWHPRW